MFYKLLFVLLPIEMPLVLQVLMLLGLKLLLIIVVDLLLTLICINSLLVMIDTWEIFNLDLLQVILHGLLENSIQLKFNLLLLLQLMLQQVQVDPLFMMSVVLVKILYLISWSLVQLLVFL